MATAAVLIINIAIAASGLALAQATSCRAGTLYGGMSSGMISGRSTIVSANAAANGMKKISAIK